MIRGFKVHCPTIRRRRNEWETYVARLGDVGYSRNRDCSPSGVPQRYARRRMTRLLQLPDSLKRRLLHLRLLTGTQLQAELDADQVQAVQKSIGLELGDGLLALFANNDAALARYELRLRHIATHTNEFRSNGGPRGMIAIGRCPDGKFLIGTAASGLHLHLLGLDGEETRVLVVETWLDELIAEEIENLRDELGDAKARTMKVVNDSDVAGFEPRLVVDDSPKRKVTHPKFGPGVVIAESDDKSKLEILFADGTTRTLLARFVNSEAPPPPDET